MKITISCGLRTLPQSRSAPAPSAGSLTKKADKLTGQQIGFAKQIRRVQRRNDLLVVRVTNRQIKICNYS